MDAPKIMLVEDEAIIAMMLEEEITDAGFHVTFHSNSEEALLVLDSGKVSFRALLTDIDLGRQPDGWNLAHRARELDPQIAIIYMSGKSAADWRVHGVPDSIMLQKPFAMPQLVTALSQLLNAQAPASE